MCGDGAEVVAAVAETTGDTVVAGITGAVDEVAGGAVNV